MSYQVVTSNQPKKEDGSDRVIEVDDNEFVDLQRQGLLVPGKGDLNDKGELKKTVEAPPEVRAATPTLSSLQTAQEG